MDKYTDGQLYIRYYNKNDQDAFRIIFEKHRNGLLLFLYGMVKNMDDAEELMMDTFAVLSSKTARYTERKDVSFKTWLYAIGRNQSRMFLRNCLYNYTDVSNNRGQHFLCKNDDGIQEQTHPNILYIRYVQLSVE